MALPVSVLVVDDTPRNVIALEAALASVDCQLVTATSGREALRRVLAQDFAVIVLDVHMPDMGGFETATLIRARERSHSTPIIFLTAEDRAGLRAQEGYGLGAVDYIYEPFDANILSSKVSFFVEMFRKTVALEQRTAELTTMAAELERSEEHFRALIEHASDLILIVEENTVIRYASPSVERTLGFTREQVAGRKIAELIHPEDVEGLQTDIVRLVKTGAGPTPIGRRWRHRDGSYRMLESTGSNLLGTMSVAGLVVHARDVTERNRAEEQVRTLNAELERRVIVAQAEKLRALGQMASGIAHDLNQSLMLVASYSDLAREALGHTPPDLAEIENLLTTTTQAALDGGESVKRLLLLTSPAPEQDSRPVDLSRVVRDAAQLTAPRWRDAPRAAGRPITLDVEAEDHPTVQGSAARLRELLTNLIFNAVDALPDGGHIHLRVTAEGGQGFIEVTDSGVGMTAEVQQRIFEPFFTTKGESGTGLGLAMVYGIAEQHGGLVEVRSAPGSGSTFRISLPLIDAPVEVELAPPARAPIEPLLPLRILAVDDEPMMTKAVVRMLKPAGHMVSVAASGEEALEKLTHQTFDVILSDMGMGAGMNGWDLAAAVRSRWPNVRFVLATGWGAIIDPREAQARGVEVVLAKPYHPADLLRALARTDQAAIHA